MAKKPSKPKGKSPASDRMGYGPNDVKIKRKPRNGK
jgi:hypothetical protein